MSPHEITSLDIMMRREKKHIHNCFGDFLGNSYLPHIMSNCNDFCILWFFGMEAYMHVGDFNPLGHKFLEGFFGA
jgi:hypothetical protein